MSIQPKYISKHKFYAEKFFLIIFLTILREDKCVMVENLARFDQLAKVCTYV